MQLQKPLVILAALVLAGVLIGTTATNVSQSITLGNQAGIIQTIGVNSDALREQVKAAGEVPVAPPAKAVVSEPGKDGGKGDTGLPGRPPTADEISYSVAVYCSTRVDCKGSPGAPSTVPGAKGTAGTNGQDSTVPGPVGPESTIPGPTGSSGTDGTDGADGKAGSDGEPPYSWTQPDPKIGTDTCNRDDPFDPAKPTYTCTPAPATTPAP